jgi:amylosucrase
VNHKTGDARISGTLASLCGLEKAVQEGNEDAISLAVQKILMMQAHSFFIGGLPMLFYGDEVGYTNDYTYLDDESKSYDNRWMHRPLIDWAKNQRREVKGTIEQQLFSGTQRLLKLRKNLAVVADLNNHHWLSPHNIHVAGFVRLLAGEPPLVLFVQFQRAAGALNVVCHQRKRLNPEVLFDHWSEKEIRVGEDHEYLVLAPLSVFSAGATVRLVNTVLIAESFLFKSPPTTEWSNCR